MLKARGGYQELLRRVGRSEFFLGARYTLSDSTTRFDLGVALPDVPSPELDTTDSGLGVVAVYDTRDNIFTPNSGVHVTTAATAFGSHVGGDHDFERYTAEGELYWDPDPRLVLGARLLLRSVSGAAPFYDRPYVQLRGVPAMRYQGESAVSLEAEARWGLTKRWWLVGFAGSGWTDAGSAQVLADDTVVAGGAGFRYLVARVIGLQMGLDVAKGPEDWAVYVVFGSAWGG